LKSREKVRASQLHKIFINRPRKWEWASSIKFLEIVGESGARVKHLHKIFINRPRKWDPTLCIKNIFWNRRRKWEQEPNICIKYF
jgi:hypothetical protein